MSASAPPTRHFVNAKKSVCTEAIEGLLQSRRDLQRLSEDFPNVVVARNIPKGRVALLCGGGSGHEPAHAGYVGDGWLSAAVCGDVFASPSTSAVLAAIRHLSDANGNAGVLVLIKNYGGDVINFGYAAVAAANEDAPGTKTRRQVATYIVGDDVAFGVHNDAQRGVAGTVLLYRLLGAAIKRNGYPKMTLAVAKDMAAGIAARMRSIGASLSTCVHPGNTGSAAFDDQSVYELGLGIHGEPGKERLPLEGCDELVRRMLSVVAAPPKAPEFANAKAPEAALDAPAEQWANLFSASTRKPIVFINNLGATTDIEMAVVTRAVIATLGGPQAIVRLVTGRSMTALNMHGISLTVCLLADEELALLLDDPIDGGVAMPAFNVSMPVPQSFAQSVVAASNKAEAQQVAKAFSPETAAASTTLMSTAASAAAALKAHTDALNAYDAAVGDGDLGRGTNDSCDAVIQLVARLMPSASATGDDASSAATMPPLPSAFLSQLSAAVANAFAGTSGPLYGAFFHAAAGFLATVDHHDGATERYDGRTLAKAIGVAVAAVAEVGQAHRGDRTMLDVWVPVAEAAERWRSSSTTGSESATSPLSVTALLDVVIPVAEEAAVKAKALPARKGRARYSNGKEIGQAEPGCELAVLLLKAIRGTI